MSLETALAGQGPDITSRAQSCATTGTHHLCTSAQSSTGLAWPGRTARRPRCSSPWEAGWLRRYCHSVHCSIPNCSCTGCPESWHPCSPAGRCYNSPRGRRHDFRSMGHSQLGMSCSPPTCRCRIHQFRSSRSPADRCWVPPHGRTGHSGSRGRSQLGRCCSPPLGRTGYLGSRGRSQLGRCCSPPRCRMCYSDTTARSPQHHLPVLHRRRLHLSYRVFQRPTLGLRDPQRLPCRRLLPTPACSCDGKPCQPCRSSPLGIRSRLPRDRTETAHPRSPRRRRLLCTDRTRQPGARLRYGEPDGLGARVPVRWRPAVVDVLCSDCT